MAELDPIIAKILLKGDDELLGALERVGAEGAEHLSLLVEAAEKGASSFSLFSTGIRYIEVAVSAATAAMVAFIEQQTELSQRAELLADAFGVTSGQLQQLEQVFASSGVKVEQFERFANRLTITIAREWPQIAESIKTYADQNDSATLRVSSAILRVRDAQNALADNSDERSARMIKDNEALEASHLKLEFAAAHAASEQQAAQLSVEGAVLSVTAAQQHLATLNGAPPSAAEKQQLEISQAQLAVDNARKAEADARIAQQEKAANAALKQAQLESEYDELARKAAKNARDDAEQRQKDENAVKAAIIARGEAEERVDKLALTSVVSIRSALDGVAASNKAAASAIDLTQVSVDHLTRGIIAQAAETSKAATPTGYETMIALSNTLSKATNDQITQEQRLALVNRLLGTSMQALGPSASEVLSVLEHNTGALKHLSDATQALDTTEAKEAIESFRGSLAGLNLDLSILSQRFAIAAAPAFTAFLKVLQTSLESDTGLLHALVDGISAIGTAITDAGSYINQFIGWVARMFDTQPAAIWKGIVVSIGVVIGGLASALLAWPAIIATIVTILGYMAENWEKIKQGAQAAWAAVTDNAVTRFFERLIDLATKLNNVMKGAGWVGAGVPNAGGAGGEATEAPISRARGGPVDGPGTTTSDSIPAWLSRGEFVNNARSVAHYGVDFFHALNNMTLPGFAAGGLVPSPVRMSGGGSIPATSTLNLSIDGRSFNGLRGPKSTIDELSSFAIARQTSAAGSNPSWMK